MDSGVGGTHFTWGKGLHTVENRGWGDGKGLPLICQMLLSNIFHFSLLPTLTYRPIGIQKSFIYKIYESPQFLQDNLPTKISDDLIEYFLMI